jgi:hypothetical protein
MRVLATVPCFAEVNGSEAKVGRNAVVYPNPNSGSFSVQLRGYPVNKTADITIYDVTGRLLVREKMETNGVKEFSLNLQTGIYLIEVSTDEGRSFKSLNIN